ncbi:methylated-DNA--[protein]-cysteine S-methyltransferase [Nocardia sp. NBC_00403]|uniref:methylated-DNA--[protein]-cysteine S-methyltransferase n=1 Tax=Nocardia sp. NBC_00403 TaxID=2975990 RepID=UPI003FA55E17
MTAAIAIPHETVQPATTTADFAITETPIGPFTALVDADGAVLASGWTADAENLRGLIHPSLRPAELRHRDSLGEVTRAITAYHDGDLTAIDDIPVRQQSGEFLVHAWEVLRTVPAGSPITYTDYAVISGRPNATRAAANACARNAAALFVPCHRIFRIGGALGGFRWGLEVKRWLLNHESPTYQLGLSSLRTDPNS